MVSGYLTTLEFISLLEVNCDLGGALRGFRTSYLKVEKKFY
jgi:hypothetical protein